MRLRNIKGADEMILAFPFVENDPAAWRGRWRERFGRGERPLHLEIGMGKGRFLTGLAAGSKDVDFVGMEAYSSVLLRAAQKLDAEPQDNIVLLRAYAEALAEYFAPGEVDGIYLNFSDPWPKERHAKRRLTSPEFLERYEQILAPGGFLAFKTDNVPLFDFSVESFASRPAWKEEYCVRDLYKSPYIEGNIPTEYEIRFRALGNAILGLRMTYEP